MKELKIKNMVVLVDDEDFAFISLFNWRIREAKYTAYAYTVFSGRTVLMHRLIMGTKPDRVVDHIDHNGLNNQRSNMRNCKIKENVRNRKNYGQSASGYKGVNYSKCNNSWRASITANAKTIHLGWFRTKEIAAIVYNHAAKVYHKEFACFNKLPEKYVKRFNELYLIVNLVKGEYVLRRRNCEN